MAGTSGVWPLYKAIAAAIGADLPITALLNQNGVYNITAPREAQPSYIVLGTVSEVEFAQFAGGGSSLTLMLHLWCPGPDGATCAQLYGELHRVLHMKTLELEGFGVRAAGFLALVDIASDAQDDLAHGIARYELTAIRS